MIPFNKIIIKIVPRDDAFCPRLLGYFFFFNPKIGMFHADSSKLMQVIQLGLSCLCEFKGLFGTCGNGQSILFLILLLFGLGLLIRNETRIYICIF